ncbi:MAG: hypothetical protein AABM67_17240 [Acidobacteriota bacterium]
MISKLFMSLCLVIGLGAVMTTQAQIESDVTIMANIPHAFVVRDTTLPAGKYTVRMADANENSNVLEIRSAKGKMAVLVETQPIDEVGAAGRTELVFDQIGDQWFLSKVFLKGDDSGNQLEQTKMQRRLEDGGLKAEIRSVALFRKHNKQNQMAKKVS